MISVVIPTHKRPVLLKRAIESVLNQTVLPSEILIIDDAGSKDSEQVVNNFNQDFVRYIHNVDGQGASSSRNLGAKLAKGEFIAFLDDDDEFKIEKIHQLNLAIAENPNVDVFYHPAEIVMVNENVSYLSKPQSFKQNDDIFTSLLVQNRIGGTPMVTVKRTSFIDAGLFDEQLPALEDYELWLRMAKNKAQFHLLQTPLTKCYYITKKGSVSKDIDSNMKALESIEDKYSEHYTKLSSSHRKAYECWKSKMMIHKSLLNYNLFTAFKRQLSLALYSPSVLNILSVFVLLLGPKAVFKLKAKLG